MTRDEAVKSIRDGLKRRSGKTWSVTVGRGTAWGWLRIDAPNARRTMHCQHKANARTKHPDDYEMVNTGQPGGTMTPADQAELATLLNIDLVHFQGAQVPGSIAHYVEYVARAEGRKPERYGEAYWD